MKIVKWLLIVVLALAGALVVGGWMLSPKFVVTRSVEIAAPPDKLYALVADPRRWKDWSVWNRRDPAMEMSYFGAPSGSTAGWEWKSKTEGDGRMTFTTAEPGSRLGYELFFPDFGTTSTGEFRFEPATTAAGTTRVSWVMNGDMGGNPLFRWFALFADGMVGKDFDAGLANLKALAEKG